MASYSTVKYGSQGEDVIALQMALNSAGYDLDTDGIFGKKTQQAVRDYQASQGLTVDGIVGKNTWGSLQSSIPSSSNDSTPSYTPSSNSPSVSSQLEALIAQFNSTPKYTPKTEEEIRAQAEGEYKSYYDQLRLAAQQEQATNDLALSQQRDNLEKTYDAQREASEKEYATAYSTADRQMLSRGMQRSSYAAQTLANIDTQGAQAQQAIADAQAAAEENIDEKRTLLAQQLAQQLAQYDAGYAADVLNRIRELEDQEYERGMQSANQQNSLSMQIYELMYQQERDQIADQQWQAQFDESVRQFNKSKKSSSSGSSSKKTGSAATQTPAATGGMSWGDFVSALGGGSSNESSGNWLSSALSGVGNAISSALKNSGNSDVGTVSSAAPKKTVKGSLSSLTSVSRGQSTK